MACSRFSRFLLLAALSCMIAPLAAGCGASSNSLASADAAKLHQDVAAIRSAATAGNPAAARAAVRTLEADIGQLKTAGRLAPADASVLLSDAGQVDRHVSLEVRAPAPSTSATSTPTSSTPTTTPTPPAHPSPPPPGAGHGPHPPGPGKDKGKGKDHGHGHGGGGD